MEKQHYVPDGNIHYYHVRWFSSWNATPEEDRLPILQDVQNIAASEGVVLDGDTPYVESYQMERGDTWVWYFKGHKEERH